MTTTTDMNKTHFTAEAGRQEIWIRREFEAPREKVFAAFTDAKLLKRWLGPRGYEMIVEEFNPRRGGVYRYLHVDLEGRRHAFRGVVHEVIPNERIVQTFEYEGWAGNVALESFSFEALPEGRTRVVTQSVFPSVETRDRMIESGMEGGVRDSHERLEEYLREVG